MRKIYLLISLFLISVGCEKDEIQQSTAEEQLHQKAKPKTLKEINFKNLPDRLKGVFDNKNLVEANKGKSSNYFGSVNLNKPVKEIIDEDGNSSFTFLLNKNKNADSNRPLYFDNLVIFEKGKKEGTSYVIRYEPTLAWYKNSKDFTVFTGNITFYTLEGKVFNKLSLKEGKPTPMKSGCTIELKSVVTICTDGGSIDGEGSSIDETCVTTYNYEVNCTAGGGSPSGGDDGGGPHGPGPGGGGDGSNDGPGSGGDDPIDFEPVEGWTPPTLPDEIQVNKTEEFEDIEKIDCTFLRLVEQKSIADILIDFFGEDALFNVTFNVVEDLNCNGNTNATGCTTPLAQNNYRIDIDKDYINDPNTPTIFLAQTLVHEAIHASLYAAVKKLNNGITPTDTSFEALYEDYRQKKDWQHEYMADHYTDIMQEAIREVHPNLNDDQFLNNYDNNTLWDWDEFYEYISYRGLDRTEAGEEYFDNAENISLYQDDTKTNSTKEPNCN